FVDSHHQLYIAETLLARRQRLFIFHDALGHVVHFGGKMVTDRKFLLLDEIPAAYLHAQAAIPGSRIQIHPALRAYDAIVALRKISITGSAIRKSAAGKTQLKIYGLLNFL